MEVQSIIEKLAEKHKIPEGDVQEVYEAKLEESKEGGMKGDEAEKRAIERTFLAFKKQEMSSSVGVEGVLIGAGDRYDAVDYSRRQAIEAYKENPQKAIKEGQVAVATPPEEASNLTGNGVEVVSQQAGWAIIARPDNANIEGYDFAERGTVETDDANTEVDEGWRVYPLDTRETWGDGSPNDRYGTPTDKHQWKRRGFGLFITPETDGPTPGFITFTGKKSYQNPPLFKALQFKARANVSDNGMLFVNTTNDTELNENPDLEERMNSIDSLIEQYFTDYLYDLGELMSHLQDASGRETIIATGDVATMDLEENSNGTLRAVVSQLSFAGGEMKEYDATVWIPGWQKDYIDFAVESRVYVVGQAHLQDAYDPAQGKRTSDKQEIVINAQGLYADPTSKIPRETETSDLDESDLDFGEDEAEVAAEFDGGEDW